MDNCDGVKTGLVSDEQCFFPQNWFKSFKLKYLVVLIIKKKSGYNETSRKYSRFLSVCDKESWRERERESMVGY